MQIEATPESTKPNAHTRHSSSTLYTVQALRGLAALLVVLHHARSMWYYDLKHTSPPFFYNGRTGVDIFFVLSGFIIPLSLYGNGSIANSSWTFFTRRLQRIVPLYWLCTILKLLLVKLSPGLSEHASGSTWHVVSSFLFLPSFDASHVVEPVLPLGWTLNMEMLFYVVIALLLLVGARLSYALPLILILLGSICFFHVPPSVPLDPYRIPLVIEFLFGLVLFIVYRNRTRTLLPPLPPAWAGSIGITALLLLVLCPAATRYPLVWGGVLATALVGCALELEGRIGTRIPRVLLLIGDASYSIYLTHWFLISIFRKLFSLHALRGMNSATAPMIVIAITACLVGIAVYHFVESPINRFFRVRRHAATYA